VANVAAAPLSSEVFKMDDDVAVVAAVAAACLLATADDCWLAADHAQAFATLCSPN